MAREDQAHCFAHPRAGRNFAGLYSLVGSCIANDVEPTAYLTDVLMRVRNAETDADLDALLRDPRRRSRRRLPDLQQPLKTWPSGRLRCLRAAAS